MAEGENMKQSGEMFCRLTPLSKAHSLYRWSYSSFQPNSWLRETIELAQRTQSKI